MTGDSATVWVVDDDRSVRFVLATALSDAGYVVSGFDSADAALSAHDFDRLLELRERVAKVLEPMRASGEIGAALEAEIELHAGTADQIWLTPLVDELRFFLISGDVKVVPFDGEESRLVATRTAKPKCVRCWHHRADVGAAPDHPQLCGRCVSNVDGAGEDRKWF